MNTQLITLNASNYDQTINYAAELLKNGECVAFPTETVYGLGANALNPTAVKHIFEVKNRANDNPLIVHIADKSDAQKYAFCSDMAYKLMDEFWPGPLTLVMPKKDIIPSEISCGLDSVAIRFPSNKIAQDLIRVSGLPIAAPSANLSGSPSPTEAIHVYQDLNGRIPLIIDGGACNIGIESTVLSVTSSVPLILRPGIITPEQIEKVCGHVDIHPSALSKLKSGDKVSSPGMKYKHYAPKAELTIIMGKNAAKRIQQLYNEAVINGKKACILVPSAHAELYKGEIVICGHDDAKDAAHDIYSSLRHCDEIGSSLIFAEGYEPKGEGLALMNRLLRAAAFRVINTDD